jgi:GGDEF domain-containing protein
MAILEPLTGLHNRRGGEEFVVVMPDADPAKAYHVGRAPVRTKRFICAKRDGRNRVVTDAA